jgi:DNA modification methylase
VTSWQILQGDCRETLVELDAESVQCCITSPPYFGLRDYGHDGQLGLEPTPQEYVAALVETFREVRRVLRDDGTFWLNLGDSYAGSWGAQGKRETPGEMSRNQIRNHPKRAANTGTIASGSGLKPKDLIGIPWRVAFALQDDGWYLRSDIIWAKPNPMPESVTDRPTRAHEYLFLFTKSPRYFYDADAIREPAEFAGPNGAQASPYGQGFTRRSDKQAATGEQRIKGGDRHSGFNARWKNSARAQTRRAVELAEQAGLTQEHLDAIRAVGITDGKAGVTQSGAGRNDPAVQALADEAREALGGYYREFVTPLQRNRRSVWTVPTRPYTEAHFATFPPGLIEPCVLAGCPEDGTVIDPFAGAGTTGLVALRHGRSFVGIELNPEYVEMARRRIVDDAPLLNQWNEVAA